MATTRVTVDEFDVNADDERVAALVTDDGAVIVVPVSMLPEDVRRGDVLTLTLDHDSDETVARRRRVLDLQKRLFG